MQYFIVQLKEDCFSVWKVNLSEETTNNLLKKKHSTITVEEVKNNFEEFRRVLIEDLTELLTSSSEVLIQNLSNGSEVFRGLVLNVPDDLLKKEVYSFYSGNQVTVINIGE